MEVLHGTSPVLQAMAVGYSAGKYWLLRQDQDLVSQVQVSCLPIRDIALIPHDHGCEVPSLEPGDYYLAWVTCSIKRDCYVTKHSLSWGYSAKTYGGESSCEGRKSRKWLGFRSCTMGLYMANLPDPNDRTGNVSVHGSASYCIFSLMAHPN